LVSVRRFDLPQIVCFVLTGLLIAATLSGCSDTNTEETPVAHFKRTQQNTNTPHGRVIPDSVEAVGSNYLQYKTGDGSTFKVHYFRREDGTFWYGNAERVE
jgi:hypothetical protein